MRRTANIIREERIEIQLKKIAEFYDLAYMVDGVSRQLLSFKKKLKLENNEKELFNCCKIIALQIYQLEKVTEKDATKKEYLSVATNLRQVFNQIRDLISEEYRTLRNRNARLPQIETIL